MFKTILVPLDGSTLAERALAPAGELARRTGATIVLVRAPNLEPPYAAAESVYGLIYPEQAVGRSSAEARDYLRAIQTRLAARGIANRTVVAEGDAAGAIAGVAVETSADLIVMSSHGYSGLTRWLLGSVAEKVLKQAGCPVLVVRSQQTIRRVLITLDGGALAWQAMRPAIGVAAGLGADVTLLRVVSEFQPEELRQLNEYESGLGSRLVDEAQEEADRYLQAAIHSVEAYGLPVNCEVRSGLAADAIREYAQNHAIDVIAMATHGRTGLQSWLHGSVTEKVLRAGDTSMLVVRPANNLN